jgi:XTP/dITP diphosphohydrolase
MTKKFTGRKLLIASGNSGKLQEIAQLLAPFPIEIVSTKEFNLLEPEETGNTFIENAAIKARYYGDRTGLPALADDSGLCISALGGKPGIHSARWAEANKGFTMAMSKIEAELVNKADKSAYFACALSLYWPEDNHFENVEGRVDGLLTFPPRGKNGFGYDPIFIANNYSKTFAEMHHTEKHKISHRANAFQKLITRCFSLL